MEIAFNVIDKLPRVFELLIKYHKNNTQLKCLLVDWLETVNEFSELYSLYSRRRYENGINDDKLKRLEKLHYQHVLRYWQIKGKGKVKPYMYIGLRSLLNCQMEFVYYAPRNEGIVLAGLQRLEGNNTFHQEELVNHLNGDFDQGIR
eukprot:191900_1